MTWETYYVLNRHVDARPYIEGECLLGIDTYDYSKERYWE